MTSCGRFGKLRIKLAAKLGDSPVGVGVGVVDAVVAEAEAETEVVEAGVVTEDVVNVVDRVLNHHFDALPQRKRLIHMLECFSMDTHGSLLLLKWPKCPCS